MATRGKGGGKTRAGVHAQAQQMADTFRQKLEKAPTIAKASTKSLLPHVDSISLDDLTVEVPAAGRPSDEQIQLMLRALLREKAQRRQRKDGEEVAEGDEILIDALGYHDGKLLPFVGRADQVVIADSFFDEEGLARGCIGKKVGETAVVDAEFPKTFPDESLRGFAYKAGVVIRGAVEVTLSDAPKDEQLKSLGLGESLAEVVSKLREHAFEQAEAQQGLAAHTQALMTLFARTGAEIPLEATQEEVRNRWRKSEGALFARQSVSQEEMEKALEVWLVTPHILAAAESSLRSRVVLDTVARNAAIIATDEEVDMAITQFGAKPSEVKTAMRESMSASVRDLKTLDYIASKAKLVVVPASSEPVDGDQPASG